MFIKKHPVYTNRKYIVPEFTCLLRNTLYIPTGYSHVYLETPCIYQPDSNMFIKKHPVYTNRKFTCLLRNTLYIPTGNI